MKYPTLKYGQVNKAVLALQNGLHRALAAKGLKHENLRNKGFGSKTSKDLLRFRRAYMTPRGPINGRVVGSEVWKALQPFLGEYDRSLIRQHNRAVAAAIAELKAKRAAKAVGKNATEAARRLRIRAVALRLYALRGEYVYRQYRPMPSSAFAPDARWKLDCSSSVTLIYKDAGEPDPNGRGYDGHGYTGTMIGKGRRVSRPEAGDLGFYGDQGGGVPRHMVVSIGDGLNFSFGSTPMRIVTDRYRSDYRHHESFVN